MSTLSGPTYFLMTLPIFTFGILFLSYIFFRRLKPTHIIPWSIIGTSLSLLLSTYGEIAFCIIYAWYMSKTDAGSDKFWIFIFMEVNLIVITIQVCISKIIIVAGAGHFGLINVMTALILDLLFAFVVIWLLLKKSDQIDKFRSLIRERSQLQKSVILYAATTCVSLYCFEAIYNLVNIDARLDPIVLGVFTLSIIINLYSLFFILKSFHYYIELTWLKRAEAPRQAYYASLNQQQKSTDKLLHDYKNLLASLQLSLQQSTSTVSTDTQAIISRAQTSINRAESSKSAFSSIKSDPLKSLLYLKWAESANHNVIMNVRTEGTIQPLDSDAGFAIIRALGILIDNALEESIRINKTHFSVLQVASDRGLEASVVNDINDDFNLAKFAEPGFTTKGRGHGNGLTIINELIQQNKNIIIKKTVINKQLKITLFIGR